MARTPDREAYPSDLEAAEAKLVAERRKNLHPQKEALTNDVLPGDAIGFGVSGGGIRSATFALGLFQAMARHHLLGKIDFLSTVSGGGYFGAFLGRLFTREWISGVADVERVVQGIEPEHIQPPAQPGWARRVFRWLRDNGRYLAPRGSGDLLVMISILLRNWVAVQVVLITTVLALFVGLQIVRSLVEHSITLNDSLSANVAAILCKLPGGLTWVWWSPWIVLPVVPLLLVAIPTGWAYWLVVTKADGRKGEPPVVGLITACAVALFGTAYYLYSWIGGTHNPVRLAISLAIAIIGVLAFLYWWLAKRSVDVKQEEAQAGKADGAHLLRDWLSKTMKTGLVVAGVALLWALVDTLGGTIYALASSQTLGSWGAVLFALLAGFSAFSRQIAVLLSPEKSGPRKRIPVSVFSWAAAIVVGGAWVIAINVGSHAIALNFQKPGGVPQALLEKAPPNILGADHLVVGRCAPGTATGESKPCDDTAYIVRAARAVEGICAATLQWPMPSRFTYVTFVLLVVFTFLFGNTRTFANLSTIHSFYAERLTRTYLGATSPSRLAADVPVTATKPDDDYASDVYWRWPQLRKGTTTPQPGSPYLKGGPLHIINTTINETYDERLRLQNQDRKGTGFAIGPCGLSVGVRHHLIATEEKVVVSPSPPSYRVFSDGANTRTPDPLSLGKWMSISGAAFSAAAGANTTVPIAVLCVLFNVRLGYWWDSGTPAERSPFEQVLPVQASLFAEMFARTRGTAGQLWNLSDGGHFENMGGYELIRRRLPIIVIVDAEADPDYTFEGLSDLVRKARLDFNAEVTFLNEQQLSGQAPFAPNRLFALPQDERKYFGNLEALRRGKWSDESVPYPPDSKQFAIEVDRERVSRKHAALARVKYLDSNDAAWLVYVKATLMGDEPEDVCHYHRAHPAFPQESTMDQFFDERQWESYRRLGQHVGHRVVTPALFDALIANSAA